MIDQRQVMNFRVQAQQLDRAEGTLGNTAVLDIGVQETGPDGGRWALAVRGVDVAALSVEDLILLWRVRGAPHLYRRDRQGPRGRRGTLSPGVARRTSAGRSALILPRSARRRPYDGWAGWRPDMPPIGRHGQHPFVPAR
jgi:hypothetical protein